MEDVLDIYQLPYNSECPVICMDEKPFQLLDEKRESIAMKPGTPKCEDSEYIRNGTCSIFVFVEPLAGFRTVSVLERRTKIDWAEQIRQLLEIHYPNHSKVVLVMDNLNTHNISSLYEAFPAEKARELARRLEIHHTPKHGSWLNIAEIELSVMTSQCLNRCFATIHFLASELAIWQADRNSNANKVDWQFTTVDARIKLKRLYPKF